MSRSDPLLMLADVARVASERPELDKTTVHALYQNLVLTQGEQPTIDQARDYVDRLTSSLEAVDRLYDDVDLCLRTFLAVRCGDGWSAEATRIREWVESPSDEERAVSREPM